MDTTLLKAAQISEILSVSKATVYRLIASGEIQAVKIRERCIRVKPEALTAYIEANTVSDTTSRN